MGTEDSTRQPGREGQDEDGDRDPGAGQVTEAGELGSQDEGVLGGADAVPETPDDNNPEREVPRTPHGSHGNPPPAH